MSYNRGVALRILYFQLLDVSVVARISDDREKSSTSATRVCAGCKGGPCRASNSYAGGSRLNNSGETTRGGSLRC